MIMGRLLQETMREKLRPLRRRIKARLHGKILGKPRTRTKDFSVAVPFEFSFEHIAPAKPIAVVCHHYHIDLAEEIYAEISNIAVAADLFISTDTEEKAAILRKTFSAWRGGRVDVRVVLNRGRDIASKYVAFRDVYDRYELVFFIHTKKTEQPALGEAWRRHLIKTLTSSHEIVSSVLWMFTRDERLGVVFPQHFPAIRHLVSWCDEYPLAQGVAQRMGIELHPDQVIDFASGSMFWARSAALRPVLDLGLTMEDFPEEAGQIGNTITHTLERLLLHVCEKAGYRWLKISNLEYCDAPEMVVAIKTPEDFDRFESEHGVQLL